MNNDYVFEECAKNAIEKGILIEIDDAKYDRILDFVVNKVIGVKSGEAHHKYDSNQEVKRFSTGFLGEAALEELLGIPIIDWSVGISAKYHEPDVPGYDIGIKSVEYGKFPIIFRDNTYPQIICVIDPENRKRVTVCGLAEEAILNEYQSDSVVLDKKLLARGSKTGFVGLEHLKKVQSLEDLKEYKKEPKNMLYEARSIVRCVVETKGRFGTKKIIKIVQGQIFNDASYNIRSLKTFGELKNCKRRQLELLIKVMIEFGYIKKADGKYPVLVKGDYSYLDNENHEVIVEVAKKYIL